MDVEYRLSILGPISSGGAEPSAPPLQSNEQTVNNNGNNDIINWEEARKLISIDKGSTVQ